MSNEQAAHETKAVTRSYLQRLTLALRSRAWRSANFECAW
jgi:hypothetical protein